MKISRSLVVLVALVLTLLLATALVAGQEPVALSKWTAVTGNWSVQNGTYVNTDNANSNTNAYAEVAQNGTIVTVEWTVEFKGHTFSSGPAAGMHILSDDISTVQRGNSYLIFQDSGFIRLYRAAGTSLPKAGDFPAAVKDGDVFTYKVVFNTKTGEMKIYRNNTLVGEWVDPAPYKNGKYISLRTNGTIAAFKDVKVTNQ